MFNNKNYRQYLPIILSIVSLVLLTLVGFFSSEKWLSKQAEKVQPKVVLAETISEKSVNLDVENEKEAREADESSVDVTTDLVITSESTGETIVADQVVTTGQFAEVATVDNTVNYTETANYTYDTTSYATSNLTSSTTTLANGNTAGEIGSYAAAQMAAATGVAQETWEYIIARESNGDPSAANASGASGLFQTIPGWGSTATVEDQIQSALNAYNSQGLAAWGY